jgi:20S proteasome alpha/beta subunit
VKEQNRPSPKGTNRMNPQINVRIPTVVTIISALVCREAIVIASDSRTSDEDGSRDDTVKISHLAFANGFAIMATSGDADIGSLITERMEFAAPTFTLRDHRTAPEALDKTCLQFKREQAEKVYCCPLEKLRNEHLIRGVRFNLLLAYYFDSKPYIYTAEIPALICTQRTYHHWSLGCGKAVANYLLIAFDVSSMTSKDAVFTAAYIIREIKRSDNRCGGPTQISIVSAGNKPEKLSPKSIQEKELLADRLDEQRKAAWDASKDTRSQVAMQYQNLGSEWLPAED